MFTIVFSSSVPSCICISNLYSCRIFLASAIVLPVISGTVISFFNSISSGFPCVTSKYGNISDKIWPPNGAATPPLWLILTTLLKISTFFLKFKLYCYISIFMNIYTIYKFNYKVSR